jgi:hypothetical protein
VSANVVPHSYEEWLCEIDEAADHFGIEFFFALGKSANGVHITASHEVSEQDFALVFSALIALGEQMGFTFDE